MINKPKPALIKLGNSIVPVVSEQEISEVEALFKARRAAAKPGSLLTDKPIKRRTSKSSLLRKWGKQQKPKHEATVTQLHPKKAKA